MSKRTAIVMLVMLWTTTLVVFARNVGSWSSQLDLLVDVRHEIVNEYVEDVDETRLVQSAVDAMVDSLDDPYTDYMPPEELKNFDKMVRGSFSGIGAQIDLLEDQLRIVTPLEDSPAWKAGILAGDLVLEIDGKPTQGISLNDAVDRLTGPEGSTVQVKVRHPDGKEQVIDITRARIEVQTVKGFKRNAEHHWDYMIDPDHRIGYVRLTQFTEKTAGDLRAAIDELVKQDVKAVILDVRFNGGGLLQSAKEVSDLFLPEGKRIVSIKGRTVPERVMWSSDEGTMPDVPMVVLANESSASASEIVAGALSDNGRAKLIGTRTFGKGSVQQVKMLPGEDQGALKITNAYYYLPNGRNIHKREGKEEWGVDPQDGFYVPMTIEQVRSMIETRRDSDVIRREEGPADETKVTPQWIEKQLHDPQLAAALEALLGRLNTGDWPKVGKSGAAELARITRREGLMRQRELVEKRLGEIDEELAKLDLNQTPEAVEGAVLEKDPEKVGEQPKKNGVDLDTPKEEEKKEDEKKEPAPQD